MIIITLKTQKCFKKKFFTPLIDFSFAADAILRFVNITSQKFYRSLLLHGFARHQRTLINRQNTESVSLIYDGSNLHANKAKMIERTFSFVIA